MVVVKRLRGRMHREGRKLWCMIRQLHLEIKSLEELTLENKVHEGTGIV